MRAPQRHRPGGSGTGRDLAAAAAARQGVLLRTAPGSAVVIESIFDWQGLGTYAVLSIATADYQATLAVVLMELGETKTAVKRQNTDATRMSTSRSVSIWFFISNFNKAVSRNSSLLSNFPKNSCFIVINFPYTL